MKRVVWQIIDSLDEAKCATLVTIALSGTFENSGVVTLTLRTVIYRVYMNVVPSRSNEGLLIISIVLTVVVVSWWMCLLCQSGWYYAEPTKRTSADAESNEPRVGHSRTLWNHRRMCPEPELSIQYGWYQACTTVSVATERYL